MKVAYDISMLGSQHGAAHGRRGVDRVVEEVLHGLLGRPSLEVALTATHALRGAQAYRASEPRLASVPLLAGAAQERVGRITQSAREYIRDTIHQRSLPRRAIRRLLVEVIAAGQELEQRLSPKLLAGFDVFHSPFHGIPSTLRGLPHLQKFLTIYDLIPLHIPGHKDRPRLQRTLRSIDPGDWILCISQYVKDDFCSVTGHDEQRVFVTPLAAVPATFYPCKNVDEIATVRLRYSIPCESPYLLSLCAMEPRKNLKHFVATFGELVASGEASNLHLVLVGVQSNGQAEALAGFIASRRLTGRVILTGFVPDQDLAALYSGALAFVFPSLAEGFGLPPLEAMQCGTPVICSNATSLPEVVGQAGLSVPPTDGDALAKAVLSLYKDPALRKTLSTAGRERASEFSWSKCVDLTLAAYRNAVKMQKISC